MSLRLVVIGLILVTATALGVIAFRVATPPQTVVQVVQPPVPTGGYLVAARALPAGTLLRDTDFAVKRVEPSAVPANALTDGDAARASLRGALLRRYLDAGTPLSAADVIRPRDRGFLASVLAPGTRAVTVGVDQVTGVAGLIWPGDLVDVILTQELDATRTSLARRVLSETILTGIRVIAVDQDIVQGGATGTDAAAGRPTKTVTLQVSADQAERLTVAQQLGHLALAVRAIGEAPPSSQATVYSGDVSPALERQVQSGGARVQVILGEHRSEVTFQ